MKTLILPGYWYCDAHPNGSYVASRFNSDNNVFNGINYPGHKLIWTVLDSTGLKFAGSGHDDDHAWEFNNGWTDKGINAGLHAVIYDKDNNLIVIQASTGSNPTGALGYRYIDDGGNLVSTVDTYSPVQPMGIQYGIKNLWEFTIRDSGKIIVGQGLGVEALVDGKHRINISKLINDEIQDTRDVNFHMSGENLSISWYFFRSSTDYNSCFVWITKQELRALITQSVPLPEPLPVEKIMIKAFERPMWMSPFFSHSSKYGMDTSAEFSNRGNAIWIEYGEAETILSKGYPLIVSVDPNVIFNKQSILNQTIAWWVSGSDINQLVSKIQQLLLTYPEKPIIAYLDADSWPTSNPFETYPDRIWPSIQAYRFPNESLINFKGRINAIILKVSSYNLPMFLTTRFDDFNGSSTVQNIVECMSDYERWLRAYNFIGHMPFSSRRGNAISSNQILQDWARAFLYAIPFERPNRFDYWRSEGSDIKAILENKLGQSRASIVLEPYLRNDILSKYLNIPPVKP